MGKDKTAPKEEQKQQPKKKEEKKEEVECNNGVCIPKEKIKQNNPENFFIIPKSKKQKEKELKDKMLSKK